eukprot:6486172-Prorocentrum_lima.AAC.1
MPLGPTSTLRRPRDSSRGGSHCRVLGRGLACGEPAHPVHQFGWPPAPAVWQGLSNDALGAWIAN